MFEEVPGAVWFAAVLILGLVTWLVIWATNKGYSRQWDKD